MKNYYVSPQGNDAYPGSIEQPFATIHHAQAMVREFCAQKKLPATVYIRKGSFYLSEALVFDIRDSGSKSAPIIYSAFPGEEVVLSGGRKLELGWKKYKNGILKAQLSENIHFDMLFVDGQKMHRARYPNFNPDVLIYNGYAEDALSPARIKNWKNPAGGFIHAIHSARWGGYHYQITGISESGELEYIGGWQNNRQMGMHKEHRFVDNIFEELDAPGEWFLDAEQFILYFYPPNNVDLKNCTLEVSRLKHVVEFRGDINNPVKNIQIKNITITHTSHTFMQTKEPLLRSDWAIYRGGAVLLENAKNITLENLHLHNLGGNAVFVNNKNSDITIKGCHIHDVGANAVCFVGDPKSVHSPLFEYHQTQTLDEMDHVVGPQSDNYPTDCLLYDNLIYRCGRLEKQAAAVQISMAMDITVSHNSIYETPRAGINISEGTFGGHILEFNDVFDTVLETGDHGSFNSWGRDRFWHKDRSVTDVWMDKYPDMTTWDMVKVSVIRNNRFRCDHGWDIDLDDGSSHYEVYNNLCLNGGIKNREGYHRNVYNNIMVNNTFHPHAWYRDSKDVFAHNIVFQKYQPIRMPYWGKEIDCNFQHIPGGELKAAIVLQKMTNKDENSMQGDALFVDPQNGDYRVHKGSPALKLGFVNFAMDEFGVMSKNLRAIARTPQLPQPMNAAFTGDSKNRTLWHGAVIDDIDNDNKVSATGMDGKRGVYFVNIPVDSKVAALEFAEGDVLLTIGDEEIKNVKHFLEVIKTLPTGKNVHCMIHRNQTRIGFDIDFSAVK